MNWRIVIGSIILILGIWSLYVAISSPAPTPSGTKGAIAFWIFAGSYFVWRGVMVNKSKS